MIYLDNAATTYPKPNSVSNAVFNAIKQYGANPGRGGHTMSIKTAQKVYDCRKSISNLFNANGEESIIFTQNCTCAVNMVLKGVLKSGDHVVVSCLEHNAVMRPLKKLSDVSNITYSTAKVYPGDDNATLDSFRNSINEKTRLIVCMHASNVFGIRLPIERISAMAGEYGIDILVDAAQSAGVIPIDIKDLKIDYLCTSGHKGLYGPMGTGILIINSKNIPDTIIEGGTGTSSREFDQPDMIPDKFESGTINVPGIIGLKEGVDFVRRKKVENISKHEFKLIGKLYDNLSKMQNIELYTIKPDYKYFVPLLSFNVKGMDSEEVSRILNNDGIAVRAGIHCAPAAHIYFNTIDKGTVRVAPSVFTTENQIDYLISSLKRIKA